MQPIAVRSGFGGTVNLAFTSVRLCAPGDSANCQIIDHIVVDTGSIGLRIMSSALPASLSLPQQEDANKDPVFECEHFVDGHTWGPVKLADLQIAGEQASGLPIQVIVDANTSTVPSRCSGTGRPINTVDDLGANGILGVGVFRQDCGDACAQPNNRGIYYTCVSSVCRQTPIAVVRQVQNPVSKFDVNNNGVIIQLPSVKAAGAISVSGSLVFGIGTQANNALGEATVVGLNPNSGNFTTVYNGNSYSASFLDSGSNALFFQDSMKVCASTSVAREFYCPASTINPSATIQGANGATALVNFSVANADTLVKSNPGFAAFGNLGAPEFAVNTFDWGLPFFFGRRVYTAIEGAGTPGGPTGPYVAFVAF